MKKWQFQIMAILFFTTFLLSCGGCKKETPYYKKQTFEKVVVVGSQWYGHIPVWIGIEKGIFQKHGFEIEWRFISSSMKRLNTISSDEAQFASLGEIAMLKAMADEKTGFYWVGTQDNAPGLEGLVAAKGIDSFEKLRGKKIGFPFDTSVDLTCRMLLKQNGLDPNKDNITFYNIKMDDILAVFRACKVDAALIWEPAFSQLRSAEGVNLLGMDTDTEAYKEFGTMTGPDVLIISKSWVDKDPPRARRFLKAYFESLKWVKENTDKAIEIVQGKYIQQNLSVIKKNMEEKFTWHNLEAQKQLMSDEGIFPQVAYISTFLHKDLKSIPEKPDFTKWVNLDILPFEAKVK